MVVEMTLWDWLFIVAGIVPYILMLIFYMDSID